MNGRPAAEAGGGGGEGGKRILLEGAVVANADWQIRRCIGFWRTEGGR